MEAHAETPEPAEKPAAKAPEKPTGPVAAVLLAAGIGALVLAVLTVWASASEGFKDSLTYSDRVGSLSGKTIWAAAAFLASWVGLSVALWNRQVDLSKVIVVVVVLLALGYLGTFAPFFELFESD